MKRQHSDTENKLDAEADAVCLIFPVRVAAAKKLMQRDWEKRWRKCKKLNQFAKKIGLKPSFTTPPRDFRDACSEFSTPAYFE